MSEHDLGHHGDAELAAGLVDLAVNVRRTAPPAWLTAAVAAALGDVSRYPDAGPATQAVADRHGVPTECVLIVAGAAEAFTLFAQALAPRSEIVHPLVVHPQFTEPERALRAAGHEVDRLILERGNGFAFDPRAISEDVDLVMIGNPTNPTSVLHSFAALAALGRPGRVVCVDEAFLDTVPGEPHSLTTSPPRGYVVVRSLTKVWGIAGLRAGYVIGDPDILRRMRAVQPPWSVNALALAATVACCAPIAVDEAEAQARSDRAGLTHLIDVLSTMPGIDIPARSAAPFALVHVEDGERRRLMLRDRGWAIRGCASFPGLGPDWWRITARDSATIDRFAVDLGTIMTLSEATAS